MFQGWWIRGSAATETPKSVVPWTLAALAACVLALGAGAPARAAGAPAPRSRGPAPVATASPRAGAAQTAATVPGVPRFFNYVSPPGSGDDAGEPSIGSNWTSERSFSNSAGAIPNGGTTTYFGGFLPYMLKITFDDCASPAQATWEQKPLLTASTPRELGDPILFTDHTTGRTFVSQLEGLTPAGSTTDITDNDGDTFSPSQGGSQPSCVDHQTLGGGPFHTPLPPGLVYPNAVYYASQCVADAVCAVSLDGGLTFGPSVPMFTAVDCAGLHGHIKVAPDGTVYVPDKACGGTVPLLNGGNASVIVSEDNGLSWSIRTVPSPLATTTGDDDPSVGIATDGTVYLGWQSVDGHPRIAVSHDKGATWTNLRDVGAALGIQNCAFPAVVAGDPDRAAFAFYGTTTAGDYSAADFPGVWYLYIATSFDGGNTWNLQNVTPGDPVQRGGICNSGTCRNQLDFFDMTIDKEGRILVGWDDGCIGNCVAGPPNSFTAKATITRQSGGMRMLAAFDPIEPAIPQAPGASAHLDDGIVTLAWNAPDNGGADLTGYNVYRSTAGGPFTRLATVPGIGYTDLVNPTVSNVYRVTAVNALGEGPWCQDVVPSTVVAPTACKLPGLPVVNDVNPDGSDNDGGVNTPPDPSVNVRSLALAEPWVGPNVNQLTFTLQVTPSSTGIVPPSSQWYILWNRQTIAADGSDRRFVEMRTDATGAPSFLYGNFGPPLPLDGSLPALNANTPEPLGAADSGSYNPATGVITIHLATAHADDTPLGPGSTLAAMNVRTYFARPDTGQKSQNNASDITGNGTYTLAGNGSCFCTVDQPPVAGVAAAPTSGNAPLTVQFDASSSFDPDAAAGDAVASYTFDFGDGSSPVTTSNPVVSHTYTSPSGSSGFFATLTVSDQKCGTRSLNVASTSIEVSATTGVSDVVTLPRAFKIQPLINPSRGTMSFALDLVRDGMVSVELFGADGRRVAQMVKAWMPAGTHSLHWNAADAAGNRIAAGVYLVRAQSNGRQSLSRVVLIP